MIIFVLFAPEGMNSAELSCSCWHSQMRSKVTFIRSNSVKMTRLKPTGLDLKSVWEAKSVPVRPSVCHLPPAVSLLNYHMTAVNPSHRLRPVHPFIHPFVSLVHPFINPFVGPFVSLVHRFIRSFVHLFIHSSVHSSHPSTHSFVHSSHSSIHSYFIHPFIPQFVPLVHPFIRPFVPFVPPVNPFIRPFVPLVHQN